MGAGPDFVIHYNSLQNGETSAQGNQGMEKFLCLCSIPWHPGYEAKQLAQTCIQTCIVSQIWTCPESDASPENSVVPLKMRHYSEDQSCQTVGKSPMKEGLVQLLEELREEEMTCERLRVS